MKTTTAFACLLLSAVCCLASTANAQELRFGPIGIRFDDHQSGRYERIGWCGNEIPPRRPVRPPVVNPWENPTVYDGQTQLERLVYNPRTGRWEVKTNREVIKESALDPNRDVIDRGSYRVRSSLSRDRFGRTIETRVESWTSFGVPHSNTKTRVISNNGNIQVEEEFNVLRSTGPQD